MIMYNRIKSMTPLEMQDFIYWVYLNGNRDGREGLEDSYGSTRSYFGGHMLTMPEKDVIPDGIVEHLLDNFDERRNNR